MSISSMAGVAAPKTTASSEDPIPERAQGSFHILSDSKKDVPLRTGRCPSTIDSECMFSMEQGTCMSEHYLCLERILNKNISYTHNLSLSFYFYFKIKEDRELGLLECFKVMRIVWLFLLTVYDRQVTDFKNNPRFSKGPSSPILASKKPNLRTKEFFVSFPKQLNGPSPCFNVTSIMPLKLNACTFFLRRAK